MERWTYRIFPLNLLAAADILATWKPGLPRLSSLLAQLSRRWNGSSGGSTQV